MLFQCLVFFAYHGGTHRVGDQFLFDIFEQLFFLSKLVLFIDQQSPVYCGLCWTKSGNSVSVKIQLPFIL
jgi:hypothetical protein